LRAAILICVLTAFASENPLKRNQKQSAKKKSGGWLIAVAALIFVLILLVRLMVFVAPHGRHH
jgi:hypothetical protein